jgi:hypothetical protein
LIEQITTKVQTFIKDIIRVGIHEIVKANAQFNDGFPHRSYVLEENSISTYFSRVEDYLVLLDVDEVYPERKINDCSFKDCKRSTVDLKASSSKLLTSRQPPMIVFIFLVNMIFLIFFFFSN